MKKQLMNLPKEMKNQKEKRHSFKKLIISMCLLPLVVGVVLCLPPAPEAKAEWQLCKWAQYSHPYTNNGVILGVQKRKLPPSYTWKPTGDFHLIFNKINGRHLMDWKKLSYNPIFQIYYGTVYFNYTSVERYKIRLYLFLEDNPYAGGSPLIIYSAYAEYLTTINGRTVWIGLTNPIKSETAHLYTHWGCEYHNG